MILVTAPVLASEYSGIFVESMGIFLGIYAILAMRIGNFNISSRIKKNGVLVTSGPYSFIRHPMYLAQVVAVFPLVVDYFTWLRAILLALLIFTLLLKIRYEEKLLFERFSGYADYASRTKRLLPFIY